MRLKRYLLPTLLTAGYAALSLAPIVHAQGNFGLSQAAQGTGIPTTTTIPSLIGKILQSVLGFVGALFLLLMVYAGFLWMTARGDAKKIDTAKQMIVGAVIGVVIIASAYAVTSFVLTSVSGAASQASSSSSSSGGGGGGTSSQPGSTSCPNITCHSGSDCNASQNACYTGTCICVGEGDPATGGSTPCSVGYCDTVQQP